MTAENRAALKALFETGDTLLQTSFEDLIDSFLSLTDTSPQNVTSNVTFSGALTANKITVSASCQSADLRVSNTLNVRDDIITESTGSTFGRTPYFYRGIGLPAAYVAGQGTTLASALTITTAAMVVVTALSPTDNSFKIGMPASNLLGGATPKFIANETAVTAQIFAVTGATIDATAMVKLMPNQRMTVWCNSYNITQIDMYTIVGAKASV